MSLPRRIALLWLCGLIGSCSLLFDAKSVDPQDIDLSRAIHRIGPEFGDFPTVEVWKLSRAGDLGNRQELLMDSALSNSLFSGARIIGDQGCTGTLRAQSRNPERLTIDLDLDAAPCQVGEVLKVGSESLQVIQAGPRGIVEVVQLLHRSYPIPLVINNFENTSLSHYLIVEADPLAPHRGIVGAGVVIAGNSATGASHGVDIRVDHTRFRGFEVTNWAIGVLGRPSWEGVHVEADQVLLDKLLVHDDGAPLTTLSDSDGIFVSGDNVQLTVRNSIVFNVARTGIHIQNSDGGTLRIENCTIHNCVRADDTEDRFGCIASSASQVNIEVINTLAFGGGTTKPAFIVDSGSGFAGSSNNASDDNTHPGSDGATLGPDVFEQANGAADDNFHLRRTLPFDSVANSGGLPLPTFDEDIDGDSRGTTWSIGADQREP